MTNKRVYGAKCAFDDGDDLAANVDLQMKDRLKWTRDSGIQFVCYPLGGTWRYNWQRTSGDCPREIYLPDIQMPVGLWRTSVCGIISKWIDPDDEDAEFAELSARNLFDELDHANYLMVDSVVLELRRVLSPKLAGALQQWLSQNITVKFKIWIVLPTSISMLTPSKLSSAPLDLWSIWNVFLRSATYDSIEDPFEVGLRFCDDSDEEFLDDTLLYRWFGEMITSVWLSSSQFVTSHDGSAALNPFIGSYLRKFAEMINFIVFDAADESLETLQRLCTQKNVVEEVLCCQDGPSTSNQSSIPDGAFDTLQIPLEPLINNLSAVIYDTFEKDAVKYRQYGKAIRLALLNIIERLSAKVDSEMEDTGPKKVTAFVLGAGRGPLVGELLKQYDNITMRIKNFPAILMEAWAVEKNPSAVQTLQYQNRTTWANRVHVFREDIRNLHVYLEKGAFCRPDLVISELLGSFGDNELSPECLFAAESIFHDHTISIPRSYQSYLVPLQSTSLKHRLMERQCVRHVQELMASGRHKNIESCPILIAISIHRLRDFRINAYDCLYVCARKRVFMLPPLVPVFKFMHPSFDGRDLEKNTILYFPVKAPCSVSGFFGYFRAELFGNIQLDSTDSEGLGMNSWAPAFLPLRKSVELFYPTGVLLRLVIRRCTDSGGVWYEWQCDYTTIVGLDREDEFIRLPQEKLAGLFSEMSANIVFGELQNQNGNSYYIRSQ